MTTSRVGGCKCFDIFDVADGHRPFDSLCYACEDDLASLVRGSVLTKGVPFDKSEGAPPPQSKDFQEIASCNI
jgi:hypothetical protein